jgi:hypothetical protein
MPQSLVALRSRLCDQDPVPSGTRTAAGDAEDRLDGYAPR